MSVWAKWFERGLVGGLFVLLLTPLVLTPPLFFPYITGKAFFFRILLSVLFVAWTILGLFVRRCRPRGSLIFYSVLALTVVLALATIFGADPYQSFWSNFERMDGLLNYLHLFVFFLLLTTVIRTDKLWQSFFHGVLAVAALVIGYALLQLAGQLEITQGGDRVEATLGNASYLAVYLLLNIFLAVWLWYQNRGRRWRGFFYGVVILGAAVVLYHTATRGAILGLIGGIALAALLVVLFGREERWARRAAAGTLASGLLLVGGFFLIKDSNFIASSPVLSRFARISFTETTTEARLTVWQMALRGVAERPALGWGPENFLQVFNKYYEPKLWRQEPWFDRAHNIFLDWLVHAGLLGLAAYLFLFIGALFYVWRYGTDVITKSLFTGLFVAYAIHNLFVFDNLVSLLLFFSLLAYCHHLKRRTEREIPLAAMEKSAIFGLATKISLSALVVAGVAAMVYWVDIKPLVVARQIVLAMGVAPTANAQFDYFRKVFAAGTFGSKEASEQMIALTSRMVTRPEVPSSFKEETINFTLAAGDDLVKRRPQELRLRLYLGSLLNRLGRPAEAIRYLEEARQLSPRKQAILFELAEAYMRLGDRERALAVAAVAFSSATDYEDARVFYASLLVANGRFADAAALWPKGLPPNDRLLNAYVEARRYPEVLAIWRRKVEEEPTNIQFRFSLAAAHLVLGERQAAIAELEKALAIDPAAKGQVDFLIREIRAGRNPIAE